MKVRLFQKARFKKHFIYIVFVIVGTLSVLCDLVCENYLSVFKEMAVNVTLPIKGYVYRFANFFKRSSNSSELSTKLLFENKQLKTQIYQLQQQIAQLTKISKTDGDVILPVLGFEQSIFNSYLLVDINTNKNIRVGDVVLSPDGLVGLITHISSQVVRVTTLSDKRISIPVKSQSNHHLILRGQDKCSLHSIAIQQQSIPACNIKVGDILYTSGEGGIFRPNIPVAKVTSIGQEIEAIPIVNLDDLMFVKVIPQIDFAFAIE